MVLPLFSMMSGTAFTTGFSSGNIWSLAVGTVSPCPLAGASSLQRSVRSPACGYWFLCLLMPCPRFPRPVP